MKIKQPDWNALNKLVEQKELAKFWSEYAQYLEETGIYSNARIVLHKAAQATAKELSEKQ